MKLVQAQRKHLLKMQASWRRSISECADQAPAFAFTYSSRNLPRSNRRECYRISMRGFISMDQSRTHNKDRNIGSKLYGGRSHLLVVQNAPQAKVFYPFKSVGALTHMSHPGEVILKTSCSSFMKCCEGVSRTI